MQFVFSVNRPSMANQFLEYPAISSMIQQKNVLKNKVCQICYWYIESYFHYESIQN